jgi:CheY-like chemotaxis protein
LIYLKPSSDLRPEARLGCLREQNDWSRNQEQICGSGCFLVAFQDVSAGGRMPYTPNRNHVLVVDDDPGMLKGIRRLLRQHAYEPILFSSAEAFKGHTDFEDVLCIILDINLKDGSGIDLRHRLKADGHSVPIIYITGNDNPAVRATALQSGCIAYITKPFSAKPSTKPTIKSTPTYCAGLAASYRSSPLSP